MQTPIPEPYDITEVPHIPWVPGAGTWAALVAALAALTLLVWILSRRHSKRFDYRIMERLLSDLRSSLQGGDEINIERSSRLARRVMSHLTGRNLSELASEELRSLYPEEENADLRKAAVSLADLEAIAYSPPSPQREASAREIGVALTALLTSLLSAKEAK